jgi:hypothetical protein
VIATANVLASPPKTGHNRAGWYSSAKASSSWRNVAGKDRAEVAKMIESLRSGGIAVDTPRTLSPAAGQPKWLPSTPAVSTYAEHARDGGILAQQVLEGYVAVSDEAGIVVEFNGPDGVATRQAFSRTMLENGSIPDVGCAVRLIAHLLSAPDQEVLATEDELDRLFSVDVRPADETITMGGRRFLPG